MKFMYAVWGSELAAALAAPELHAGLAALGVDRLQLNVDDGPVRPAMRVSQFEPAIGAVVSVWVNGEPASAVTSCLREAAGVDRVEGWRVEERRPIDPPESWDGSRLDGLAQMALLRRPEELPREEWLHIWLVDHTSVAIRTQATFGYVQNIVEEALTADAPPVAALFPMAAMTDQHAFFGSGGDDDELRRRQRALGTSVSRFGAARDIDVVPTSRSLHDLAALDAG